MIDYILENGLESKIYPKVLTPQNQIKLMKEELEEYLISYGLATQEEIQLVCSINGDTLESREAILYSRTGYRTLDQLL